MTFTPYLLNIGILIGIYIILGVGLNLVLGFTGLINLGHIALFGLGAYTSAILSKAGTPFLISFLVAGFIGAVAGFILIFATRKLKGDYFALATLGFAFVVGSLMLNLKGITRGPLGIPGISKPSFFGFVINTNLSYFLLVSFVCIVCIYIAYKITESPFGKLLHAVRNDELGLRVLGKNTFKIKSKIMIVSGFMAGIAGSLFAHYISYIEPSSFFIKEIILVLTIVIIGGIASINGTILGTIIIFLIPEVLRIFNLPSSIIGSMRQVIYSIILILILMYRPRGLLGRIDLE
jgi:branched-chain amino acid transport system permease protein